MHKLATRQSTSVIKMSGHVYISKCLYSSFTVRILEQAYASYLVSSMAHCLRCDITRSVKFVSESKTVRLA